MFNRKTRRIKALEAELAAVHAECDKLRRRLWPFLLSDASDFDFSYRPVSDLGPCPACGLHLYMRATLDTAPWCFTCGYSPNSTLAASQPRAWNADLLIEDAI